MILWHRVLATKLAGQWRRQGLGETHESVVRISRGFVREKEIGWLDENHSFSPSLPPMQSFATGGPRTTRFDRRNTDDARIRKPLDH